MNKLNVILVNVPIMSDFNCLLYTAYKWEYLTVRQNLNDLFVTNKHTVKSLI